MLARSIGRQPTELSVPSPSARLYRNRAQGVPSDNARHPPVRRQSLHPYHRTALHILVRPAPVSGRLWACQIFSVCCGNCPQPPDSFRRPPEAIPYGGTARFPSAGCPCASSTVTRPQTAFLRPLSRDGLPPDIVPMPILSRGGGDFPASIAFRAFWHCESRLRTLRTIYDISPLQGRKTQPPHHPLLNFLTCS